jgi:hypothetical protein
MVIVNRFTEETRMTLERALSFRPDPSRSEAGALDDDWIFRSVVLDPGGKELSVEVGSAEDEGFSLTILIAFADLHLLSQDDSDGDEAATEAAELIEAFSRQVGPGDIHEPTVRLPLDWNPLLLH